MIYAAIQILEQQRQEKLDAILTIFNYPGCQSVCDILKKQIAELDLAIQILEPFER